MFNIIVSDFIVLYDLICMISCLLVITYAFGRCFYPVWLTCTFKVYICLRVISRTQIRDFGVSSSCSTNWASRNFISDLFLPTCSDIKEKKIDVWKTKILQALIDALMWCIMHFSNVTITFSPLFFFFCLQTRKLINCQIGIACCKFTIDIYINCEGIFKRYD